VPRLNFSDGNREAHLQAFFAWLPEVLHQAPGINWSALSSKIIGYCILTIAESPDKMCIALAMGTAIGAVDQSTLHSYTYRINVLLRLLRSRCGLQGYEQLTRKAFWEEFIKRTEMTLSRVDQLKTYMAFVEKYEREYFSQLTPETRDLFQPYLLPSLPAWFIKRYSGERQLRAASRQRRKEQSDVLVPLYHVLVALVQMRKQAAERMLLAFREARKRVEAGEELPLRFSYEEHLPEVNRAARTVEEVQIEGRPVTMQFTLWDKRSWVLAHPDRYEPSSIKKADRRKAYFKQENELFFLQCENPSRDLLWFGDIVANRLLQRFHASRENLCADERRRCELARELGANGGFFTDRPGLLTPAIEGGMFLSHLDRRPDELLFEPESLYRGCLYGAALTSIALTNGSRISELLQVSLDRRKTRTEIVQVTKDGGTEQRKTTLHLQYLLPKGKSTEEERQYFLLSPQSVTLLGEICQGLIDQHGKVPVVSPPARATKFEHLGPERYLFQWDAAPGGRLGMIDEADLTLLMRFVLHGLELTTAQGKPIRVSTHLLRHVTATVMREEAVPVEAIQWTLHHQPDMFSPEAQTLSEATEYYTQMTEAKRLQYLHRFHLAVEGRETAFQIAVPDEITLQEMDEKLRAVFERWGTINPTNFGYCGRTGLCPRGNYRALCIGCPHLVPDPAKLDVAIHWEKLYCQLAEQLRAAGSLRDAQRAEAQARNLRDIINMMRLYQQAEVDRQFVPFYRSLPMLKKGGQLADA
jgi:hypothetical protein